MKKQNRTILITGGAGYIGLNLITFFLEKKYKIFVIDKLSTSKNNKRSIKKSIIFFKIDLTNEKKVKKFFKKKKFNLIIHLAAFSGVKEFNKNLMKSFNNNVLATKNLLRYGFENKMTKLIFASSAAVYGKVSHEKVNERRYCVPVNFYGLSKHTCEKMIENFFNNKKNRYAILRYFNVVGSILNFNIDRKIKSLFDIIGDNIKKSNYKININGKNLNTRDGTPERDFIYIKDLCQIHSRVYSCLDRNKKIILNCGSGYRYSVLEIVKMFQKKINKKFKISYKVTNSDETETICSNTDELRNFLKINIKKNSIYDCVKSYL